MAIPNKYKDTFNDFIDSLDIEFPDWLKSIDKWSRNAFRSEDSSTRFYKGNCLNKNVSKKLSRLAPKTRDSQVYQHYDVTLFDSKSGRS